MYKVRVERVINKPIEDVFEMLTDHANYANFPGVKESKLLEEGETETNGVGALRYIDAGKMRLKERIIGFERPTSMAYHIESSEPLFIDLKKGQVTLSEEEQGTKVVWVSEGNIKASLMGPLMDKLLEGQFAKGFGAILKSIANK